MSKEWFESIGSPRYVVAPMVDASELAWRLLCRRHGAQLCYTPMFHSNVFTKDPKYRKDSMATCKEDRPLIVQFCGNDPDIMSAAAKLVEKQCDAIDVNLGCPQSIAKRGHYGSFLQDEWDLLQKIVSAMSKAVSVPITCKVRVFESIERSVEYALMLQNAGCKLLTVHGRTREQKGPLTGIASWKHIKAVRKAVSIPMLANGNIQSLEDVHRCIEYTGVDGVMSAEGNLTNPAIFEGINPVSWEMAEEYLDLTEKYPCPTSYIRGHLFKIFHKVFTFEENNADRQILATAQNIDDFRTVCKNVKEKYLPYHEGELQFESNENITRNGFNLILPPWICQPYVRMSPENYTQKMENLSKNQSWQDWRSDVKTKALRIKKYRSGTGGGPEPVPLTELEETLLQFSGVETADIVMGVSEIIKEIDTSHKRTLEDSDGNVLSRKKMKKLQRIMRKPVKPDAQQTPRSGQICVSESCPNPLGGKCVYQLCKKCCRNKCFDENLDCAGHRIHVYTRREMAKKFQNQNVTNETVTVSDG